jgi:hypothetical protein
MFTKNNKHAVLSRLWDGLKIILPSSQSLGCYRGFIFANYILIEMLQV